MSASRLFEVLRENQGRTLSRSAFAERVGWNSELLLSWSRGLEGAFRLGREAVTVPNELDWRAVEGLVDSHPLTAIERTVHRLATVPDLQDAYQWALHNAPSSVHDALEKLVAYPEASGSRRPPVVRPPLDSPEHRSAIETARTTLTAIGLEPAEPRQVWLGISGGPKQVEAFVDVPRGRAWVETSFILSRGELPLQVYELGDDGKWFAARLDYRDGAACRLTISSHPSRGPQQ